MSLTARLAAVIVLWSLAQLLAGCTIRLPAAELCAYPLWVIAAAEQWRCAPGEPAIIVPRGLAWDNLG